MLEDKFPLAEFAARVDEQVGRGFGSGILPERQPERFVARPARGPGENRLELVAAQGGPLSQVHVHEEQVEPVPQAGRQAVEVPAAVPGQFVGMQARQPVALGRPEARRPRGDGESIVRGGIGRQVGGQPGCAAGAFAESDVGIQVEGVGVVVADVEPEFVCAARAGVIHGSFGQGAGDAAVTVFGVDGHVGEHGDFAPAMTEADQAGVADNFAVRLPDVAGERCGRGVFHGAHPRWIPTGAAYLAQVALAVAIQAVGEAQFDEVGHLRQVAQHVEGAQVGVRLGARGEGDGGHWGNYKRVVAVCSCAGIICAQVFIGAMLTLFIRGEP